jgi:A/G-specific adenine glycosylase
MRKSGRELIKKISVQDTLDFAGVQFSRDDKSRPGILEFQQMVLSYYNNYGREMAWRDTTDPYLILVSEIMLQQTQVERVRIKFPEFIETFPDFASLAVAPLDNVLSVWQGMGYNRRAIALQKCAIRVMNEYDGILPADVDILATFPGIGRATASSIAAFAFNLPVVFIETNIQGFHSLLLYR